MNAISSLLKISFQHRIFSQLCFRFSWQKKVDLMKILWDFHFRVLWCSKKYYWRNYSNNNNGNVESSRMVVVNILRAKGEWSGVWYGMKMYWNLMFNFNFDFNCNGDVRFVSHWKRSIEKKRFIRRVIRRNTHRHTQARYILWIRFCVDKKIQIEQKRPLFHLNVFDECGHGILLLLLFSSYNVMKTI